MPLVSMKDMLNKAKAESYAVGQFNLNNLELLKQFFRQLRRSNLRLFSVFLKGLLVIWEGSKRSSTSLVA